jgi:hypothetical protein
MWMLLLVPLVVTASFTIIEAINEVNRYKIKLMIFVFTLAAIAATSVSLKRGVVFLLFALASLLVFFLKRRSRNQDISNWLLAGILVFPAFIIAAYFVIQNSNW